MDAERFAELTKGISGYFTERDWDLYRSRLAQLLKLIIPYEEAQEFEVGLEWFALWEKEAKKHAAEGETLRFIRELKRRAAIRLSASESTIRLGDLIIDLSSDSAPRIVVSFNWAPYLADMRKWAPTREVFKPYKGYEVPQEFGPAVPHEVPAIVTIRVPVSQMKAWDVKPITKLIGDVLRDALVNRPSSDEAPTMARVLPPEREFLVHCREPEFQRDVGRYKLHMQRGLTFRQIAWLEVSRKLGTELSIESLPRMMSFAVPGESSVREAVQRIYKALFLEPYRARRRRIDAPAKGVTEYRCGKHGQDCPDTCSYLKRWFNDMQRMLPSDTTGKERTPRGGYDRGRRIPRSR